MIRSSFQRIVSHYLFSVVSLGPPNVVVQTRDHQCIVMIKPSKKQAMKQYREHVKATRIFMHAAFRISAATTDRRRTPAIMCGHLTLGYQLLLNLLLLVFLRIIRARLAECAFRVITIRYNRLKYQLENN